MITVPTDYKGTVSAQTSLSDLSQKATHFTEVKNSLHDSSASRNAEMEIQEASTSAPSTIEMIQELAKKTCEPASSKILKRKNNSLNDLALTTSKSKAPTISRCAS